MIRKIKILLTIYVFLISSCINTINVDIKDDFDNYESDSYDYKEEYGEVNIALVLGGGGVKGVAHLGVMSALQEAGIVPDIIIGASAGSIAGAVAADNWDSNHFEFLIDKFNTSDFLDWSLKSFPVSFGHGYKLKNFVKKNIDAINIEDLKMPMIATATDLSNGKNVALRKGRLDMALLASSAYPGRIYPVKIRDRYFIDGGVASPVPVDIAKKIGAKYIIAVEISSSLEDKKIYSILDLFYRSLSISYASYSTLATQAADFKIKVNFDGISGFSDQNNKYIYEYGKYVAEANIHELKQDLVKLNILTYQ